MRRGRGRVAANQGRQKGGKPETERQAAAGALFLGEIQSSVEELRSLVELLGDETTRWSRQVIMEEAVSRLQELETQLGVRGPDSDGSSSQRREAS